MTKNLAWVVLLFVVSGCVTLTEERGSSSASIPESEFAIAVMENVPSNTAIKLSNGRERDNKQPLSITLDAEEIRKVQTLLKTVGFDPGRIDGAFGPKTKIALLRLRSSCSGLNDLLRGVDLEKIAPSIEESSGANRNNAARTMLRKEEIWLIQLRLKDAGFDPGTVDGVSGPNTRAAVARFRSGCGAVETIPAALLEAARLMKPGDISGATMARGDIMSVASPGGGAGSAESGSFTSPGTKDSSAGGTRRLH